jgi:hypothetical protein
MKAPVIIILVKVKSGIKAGKLEPPSEREPKNQNTKVVLKGLGCLVI